LDLEDNNNPEYSAYSGCEPAINTADLNTPGTLVSVDNSLVLPRLIREDSVLTALKTEGYESQEHLLEKLAMRNGTSKLQTQFDTFTYKNVENLETLNQPFGNP
jgi:hypothetical protein